MKAIWRWLTGAIIVILLVLLICTKNQLKQSMQQTEQAIVIISEYQAETERAIKQKVLGFSTNNDGRNTAYWKADDTLSYFGPPIIDTIERR